MNNTNDGKSRGFSRGAPRGPVLIVCLLLALAPSLFGRDALAGELVLDENSISIAKLGRTAQNGDELLVFEATPRSEAAAHALGYSRVRIWFDTAERRYRKLVFWDLRKRRASTLDIRIERETDGSTREHVELHDHIRDTRKIYRGDASALAPPPSLIRPPPGRAANPALTPIATPNDKLPN